MVSVAILSIQIKCIPIQEVIRKWTTEGNHIEHSDRFATYVSRGIFKRKKVF